MKKSLLFLVFSLFWLCATFAVAARVGDPAPAFTGKDTHGKTWRLADLRGKYVVLEWTNFDCPFTQSQYKGKMQRLQQLWTGKGVVWLRVLSAAPGTDSYATAKETNRDARRDGCAATATLMDPEGTIGRAYGAKTTPHMFVINPKGILLYDGAIDNAPLEDRISEVTRDGKPYVNYVGQALEQAFSGREVTVKTTPPYGCNVKYKGR